MAEWRDQCPTAGQATVPRSATPLSDRCRRDASPRPTSEHGPSCSPRFLLQYRDAIINRAECHWLTDFRVGVIANSGVDNPRITIPSSDKDTADTPSGHDCRSIPATKFLCFARNPTATTHQSSHAGDPIIYPRSSDPTRGHRRHTTIGPDDSIAERTTPKSSRGKAQTKEGDHAFGDGQ